MKTTLEELRNNNIGYTLGKEGITEADLCLVNGIIDKIEQTRTQKPQPLDVVEYTDSFGCYHPNAIIDGDTYRNGSTALCECGSAYVSVSRDGTLCKCVSGGTFPVIDKNKLRYLGKKEKSFWTFSTLGAGAHRGLYFKAEVSCFELNLREEPFKRYTTKDYDCIFVQDWGDRTSECGYKYTVEKGPYPHCAFHTKKELNEYLSLYEAVDEPYFDNVNLRKKYWILKSTFVSVWTEDEFDNINADKTAKVCLTGDTYLPSTLKTERRFYGMYCGQMKPNRNNLPMLSGRNKRRDSFFFPLRFFCFRCGYRSTVPRGSKRRKNSRLNHLFPPTLMRQFFLPPLTSAL